MLPLNACIAMFDSTPQSNGFWIVDTMLSTSAERPREKEIILKFAFHAKDIQRERIIIIVIVVVSSSYVVIINLNIHHNCI